MKRVVLSFVRRIRCFKHENRLRDQSHFCTGAWQVFRWRFVLKHNKRKKKKGFNHFQYLVTGHDGAEFDAGKRWNGVVDLYNGDRFAVQ